MVEKFIDPCDDMFHQTPKSSVKLIKNTKGINWEIKCVQGEAHLLEGLMIAAINIHNALEEKYK